MDKKTTGVWFADVDKGLQELSSHVKDIQKRDLLKKKFGAQDGFQEKSNIGTGTMWTEKLKSLRNKSTNTVQKQKLEEGKVAVARSRADRNGNSFGERERALCTRRAQFLPRVIRHSTVMTTVTELPVQYITYSTKNHVYINISN